MQPDSWATLLAQWADRALRSGHQNLLSEAQPEMERTLLTTALRHTQGHKPEAARLLGWGRNTLTRKLKELGMEWVQRHVCKDCQSSAKVLLFYALLFR